MVALCFRLFLLFVSFLGMNGLAVRVIHIENNFCAPLITSSLIVDLLMLTGLIGILEEGWITIYVLGLVCFMWFFVVRHNVKSTGVIIALIIFALYSVIHYQGTYFTSNDSLAHWAKVSKYLQTYNRIPDGKATLIRFASYPVGSGLWIYYVCHSIGCSPAGDLGAQMFLYCISLLPLYSLVRINRRSGYMLCSVSMLVLLAFDRFNYSIQVDWLLGYMTIGSVAILVAERENLMTVVKILPVVISLVFIKTSGLFFGLIIAWTYAQIKQEDNNKVARGSLWIVMGIFLAFLTWHARLQIVYKGYDLGKHSITLNNYLNRMKEKDAAYFIIIIKNMLKQIVTPNIHMFFVPIYLLGLFIVVHNSKIKDRWLKRFIKLALFSLMMLVLWYIMLGLVYYFSMSNREAETLASFTRYQATVGIILFGYGIIFLLSILSDHTIDVSSGIAWKASGILSLLCLVYSIVPFGGKTAISILFDKSLDGMKENGCIYEIKRDNGLEEGKKIFAFALKNDKPLQIINALEYEFFSEDINVLFLNMKEGVHQYELFSIDTYVNQSVDDLADTLAGLTVNADYILLVDNDKSFERSLNQALKDTGTKAEVFMGHFS